ncbi:SPX domain-containing protein 4 [Acorus gramineus]|uniref:SPX domain-containing protein 4 n=1 Tax=Acorus gramineus TaxID=55184 RepID=A0AAV9BNT5_ACOGR|nr:SPX domain-containing protein 4 [Acorus gramineus]
MKFGKEFKTHLEETLPEWRDKFLCYKLLKKLLKNIPANDNDDDGLDGLEHWFARILDVELDKFNDFFLDKEEDFIIRLRELKGRIDRVKEKTNEVGAFTSESEFSEEMLDIRRAFVTIHGEMVLLKNYSSLNFAGLVKILKKYDKRTGGLLSFPFTQRALHQPFFTTEPLTSLVRACETSLELLFPLEAEVVESNSENQTEPPVNANIADTASHEEDTMDIHRSILAALKAIQGLRKASSTYNPLSLARFFNDEGDESIGTITVENSVSNSSTTLQIGDQKGNENVDADQEGVQSNK